MTATAMDYNPEIVLAGAEAAFADAYGSCPVGNGIVESVDLIHGETGTESIQKSCLEIGQTVWYP